MGFTTPVRNYFTEEHGPFSKYIPKYMSLKFGALLKRLPHLHDNSHTSLPLPRLKLTEQSGKE